MKQANIDPAVLAQFPNLRPRKETPLMHRAKKVREGFEDKLCAEQIRRHERQARIVTRSKVEQEDYTLVI